MKWSQPRKQMRSVTNAGHQWWLNAAAMVHFYPAQNTLTAETSRILSKKPAPNAPNATKAILWPSARAKAGLFIHATATQTVNSRSGKDRLARNALIAVHCWFILARIKWVVPIRNVSIRNKRESKINGSTCYKNKKSGKRFPLLNLFLFTYS